MDAGYTHRLMLSHDYSVPKARYGAEVQEARRRANPDGYTFISRRVLPRLPELGAPDPGNHQITVEDPPRVFLRGGKLARGTRLQAAGRKGAALTAPPPPPP